jgi:D-alanyl-D-alanine carboxypeptidase (penicillin-binding protein 5/6)
MRRAGARGSVRAGTGPSPFISTGRPARRRRRPHIWVPVIFTIVVALVVLLVLLASGTSKGHAIRIQTRQAAIHHPVARKPPTYGWALAPPRERFSVHLKLPLTSGIVFNVRTGQVLWARNPDRVLPIASLTKMMTALLVATRSRPSDRVLVTTQAVHFSGSGVGLLPLGKRVPLVSLLYGLLLPSGNDAAIALAQHVSGTQDRFIAEMNQEAHHLDLRCTHFTTVSGIVDVGNHSCAGDLAILAHLVLTNRLLGRVVGSRSAIVPFPIKGGKLYLYNNNPLLVTDYPGTDGVKTGWTTAAGQCLVAAARRGGRWYGVVLLHSANTALQGEALLNAAFAHRG